jgi:hypothetical protein
MISEGVYTILPLTINRRWIGYNTIIVDRYFSPDDFSDSLLLILRDRLSAAAAGKPEPVFAFQ